MKKAIRIGGYIIAGLAALIVLIIIVLKLISDNQYKEWITSAVESATGREINIESLELDFNTTVKATASRLQMANASWSKNPHMLHIDSMEAEIKLLRLIRGIADFRGILNGLKVISETSDEGVSNWSLSTEDDTEQPDIEQQEESDPGLPIDFIIREFRISNSTVDFLQADENNNVNMLIDEFSIETPETDAAINLEATVNSTPIHLSGNLGHLSGLVYDQYSALKLDGTVGENAIAINGDWGPFLPDLALNLQTDVDIVAKTPLAEIFGIDIIDFGAVKFSSRLVAKQGQFSISEIVTDLDGSVSDFSISGSIDDLFSLKGVQIFTKANTLELTSLLNKFNIKLPVELPPKVNVTAEFYGSLDKLGARNVVAVVADEGVDIKFKGHIDNAIDVQGIDGRLTGSIGSTSNLSRYAGLTIPDLGSIDFSADIVSKENQISLSNLDANLNSVNIKMNVTGGIEDLLTTQGIELQMSTDISSLSEQNITEIQTLLEHLEVNMPLEFLPESARLNAVIEGDFERLSISNFDAEVIDQGINAGLNGRIEDVFTTSDIDTEFTIKADSLSALSKYAGLELPATDALEASGQVKSSNDTFKLNDLQASLLAQGFNVKLEATINDLLNISGINAQLTSQIDSLSVLSEIAKTELPQTDPVSVSASLASNNDDTSNPAAISVSATSNETKIRLDANLNDLMSTETILAAIDIQAASLSDLSQFAGTQLPDQGPLKLTGNIKAEGKTYGFHDFNINLNEQKINGWASASLPETEDGITSLSGELDIPYFDLSPFIVDLSEPETDDGAQPIEAVAEESPQASADIQNDRVFSTDPIPLDTLRNFNADFSVKAEKLKARKAHITDFNLSFLMKDGLLVIEPLNALSHGGKMDGKIILDGRNDNAVMDIDFVIENFPIVQLQGTYNLNLNLEGNGTSMAEVMGGLDGQVIAVINEAKIERSSITDFGSGLFSFSEDRNFTEVECGILRMDIEDGIADFDDKLAVQLTEVTWHGGGDINLKNEEIAIAVVPTARRGISIGAGSLAGLFYVAGTLKNPRVQVNPTAVATKYGRYMAHLSTGGLSLLAQSLYNRLFANRDLCEHILDGTVFDTEAKP